MSNGEGDRPDEGQHAPTEDELRAAYEEEIRKVRVEHVLLEQVVTLVNLGMRRTGLAPGTETERDAGQVRLAVESIRALLPLLEQSAPQQIGADPGGPLATAAGVRQDRRGSGCAGSGAARRRGFRGASTRGGVAEGG